MIVLKHLARALNITPFRTRTLLRDTYGPAPGKRWRWPNENDLDYKRKLKKLGELVNASPRTQRVSATSSKSSSTSKTEKKS